MKKGKENTRISNHKEEWIKIITAMTKEQNLVPGTGTRNSHQDLFLIRLKQTLVKVLQTDFMRRLHQKED